MYQTPYHNEDLNNYAFLVTGGAGFIGSNLVEYLLKYGAGKVRVLDNLSNGLHKNIAEFKDHPSFEFIEGDIRDPETCRKACENIDYVSHQAALGSVPRSINDPLTTNEVNITGFLNMLSAVKDSRVKRIVYAASSSTYGDSKELPKMEDRIGRPLSPYAVTKYVNELYAEVFAKSYGTDTIGLRYFNVFGPKQDPNGAYAAVIPLFMNAVLEGLPANFNGEGNQTRDFTFVENVVQANIKSLLLEQKPAHHIFNIAYGERTSLKDLWEYLKELSGNDTGATYGSPRMGDIQDSLADICRAKEELGYNPEINFREGVKITFNWFTKNRLLHLNTR